MEAGDGVRTAQDKSGTLSLFRIVYVYLKKAGRQTGGQAGRRVGGQAAGQADRQAGTRARRKRCEDNRARHAGYQLHNNR